MAVNKDSSVSLPPQADSKERYSVNELLADLAGCRAARVLLFVDQSYSGVLSKRLRGSQKHCNVVLIQSQSRHGRQRSSPGWDEGSWSHVGPASCLLGHLGKVTTPHRRVGFVLSKNRSLTTSVIRAPGRPAFWSRGPAF